LESIDFIAIISIAFIGSFGHCIGMCGGIVMAYSAKMIDPSASKISQSSAHLLYSLGRVSMYTILGAIFGYLGGVITYSPTANGYMLMFAGTAMFLAGLSLLGKLKFLTIVEHSFSSSKLYKQTFHHILNSKSNLSFYFLGLLNGLLPCGFVYFFAITAASSASAVDGALVMFVFGLSTIPAMFSLGFIAGLSRATSFRSYMMSIASVTVLIYGLFTIYNGLGYLN